MRRVILLTSVCLAALGAQAQDSIPFCKGMGVELYGMIGFSSLNYKGLNNRLTADGKTTVGAGAAQLGFGAAYRFYSVVMGTEFSFLQGLGSDQMTGSEYSFFLSTNALHTKHWIFSPVVGLNLQYLGVDIPQTTAAATFDDALGSANALTVHHNASQLDLGVAIKNASWLPWGAYEPLLRLGYRLGLDNGQWTVDGTNVTGAPYDKVGSFYVTFCFGYAN